MKSATRSLSVMCLFLLLAGCKSYRSENVLQERFYHIIESGEEVRFGEITDFEWDRVDIVWPYNSIKEFRESNSEIENLPRSVAKRMRKPETFLFFLWKTNMSLMTRRYMMMSWKSDLNMEHIILPRQFSERHPGVVSKGEDVLEVWTNGATGIAAQTKNERHEHYS